MGLQQLIGYLCLLLAIAGTIAGIWASVHFSHARIYSRRLARERRATRRERAAR
jgi:hypothetical protein